MGMINGVQEIVIMNVYYDDGSAITVIMVWRLWFKEKYNLVYSLPQWGFGAFSIVYLKLRCKVGDKIRKTVLTPSKVTSYNNVHTVGYFYHFVNGNGYIFVIIIVKYTLNCI